MYIPPNELSRNLAVYFLASVCSVFLFDQPAVTTIQTAKPNIAKRPTTANVGKTTRAIWYSLSQISEGGFRGG